MLRLLRLLILSLILVGCNSSPAPTPPTLKTPIHGRGDRTPIYQASIPQNWHVHTPPLTDSLSDTRLPLCTLTIEDALTLTIHNFPTASLDERIPPRAQVERWKGQLSSLDPATTVIRPEAWGGFSGLRLETEGILAWSLVIAPEHYRALSLPNTEETMHLQQQMRADFTLKVTGPASLLEEHREEIIEFAHSFELIEGIRRRT